MHLWNLDAPHEDGRKGPLVLFSTPEARMVVIELGPDEELGDHRVRERAAIQVLVGAVEVTADGSSTACDAGSLLVFDPGERHAIRALRQSRLLLMLAPWPGSGHYDAAENEDPHELPAHATAREVL